MMKLSTHTINRMVYFNNKHIVNISNVHPDIELHNPPRVVRAGGHASELRVSGAEVVLVLARHSVAEVDLGDEALTPRPGGGHLQRGG